MPSTMSKPECSVLGPRQRRKEDRQTAESEGRAGVAEREMESVSDEEQELLSQETRVMTAPSGLGGLEGSSDMCSWTAQWSEQCPYAVSIQPLGWGLGLLMSLLHPSPASGSILRTHCQPGQEQARPRAGDWRKGPETGAACGELLGREQGAETVAVVQGVYLALLPSWV